LTERRKRHATRDTRCKGEAEQDFSQMVHYGNPQDRSDDATDIGFIYIAEALRLGSETLSQGVRCWEDAHREYYGVEVNQLVDAWLP
jgi:hypothetical protein